MGSPRTPSYAGRKRFVFTATLIAANIVIGIAGTITLLTTRSTRSESITEIAQQRCQNEVLKRLMSPSSATLSEVHAQASQLDRDGQDLFPLTLEDPLKNVDISRITVINVSGMVNAPSEIGSTIRDHFNCRAYFVDATLAHTLVLIDETH